MKIAGIIAEYNPFHNGHAYHIRKTREAGATHIVCVMSGDSVQRGDVAIFDKHARAKIAVENGADLVLELPVPYCIGTARDFARAGVSILDSLGCVDILSFGTECDSIDPLLAASNALDLLDDELLKESLSCGMTYPQALAKTVGDETSNILTGANNTLAIEYLRALRHTDICPLAIKRTVDHDESDLCGEYASASHLREMIMSGMDTSGLMPQVKARKPAALKNIESAILFRLSMMSKSDFESSPYTGDGIAERLYTASRRANTLEEIYEAVKTKNVTHARVRRAVLLSALGVKAEEMSCLPQYARILAMNSRGAEILGTCKKTASIPVSASLAELSKSGEKAARLAELDERSSRLRSLAAAETDTVSEFSKKFEIQK